MMSRLLALLALACTQPMSAQEVAPNVLIIVIDDVAAVDLNGLALPSLEGLKAQGVTFTRAYANPTCAPSRRSLQTGRFWVDGNGEPCAIPAPHTPALSEVFLPEAMPGYSSAILGKWHLGVDPSGGPLECAPLRQGYDYWLRGSLSNVGATSCEGVDGYDYDLWEMVTAGPLGCSRVPFGTYQPFAVSERFVQAWGTAPEPRMAVVNLQLCHSPFHRPPAYLLPPGYPATTSLRQKYEAMIVAHDALIGWMLTAVDLARTTVIVIGDNGTPPQVAGLEAQRAKGTTFERGVRVPMIIAGKGVVDPGRLEGALVHAVDVFATAVALAGGTSTSDGLSLVPAMEHESQPEHAFVLVGARWETPDGDVASVSADGYKLRELDPDGDGVADSLEFYDLSTDPSEILNLVDAPEQAARVSAHQAFLSATIP